MAVEAWVEVEGGLIPLTGELTGPTEITLGLTFPEREEDDDIS